MILREAIVEYRRVSSKIPQIDKNINSSTDVVSAFQMLIGSRVQESFCVLSLSNANKPLGFIEVGRSLN